MSIVRRIMAIAVVGLFVQQVLAQGRLLREARSENGQFVLRIDAGRGGRLGKPCQATLLERTKTGRGEHNLWERPLVNETAPGLALIRDDGRFVITLDEHRRGGGRHALVIYGAQGELLRHFILSDLLEKADWRHVETSRREIVWLKDARPAFDDRAEQFVIRLAWGREIRIDLKTLRVVRPGSAPDTGKMPVPPAADASGEIPPAVLALLLGHVDEESVGATGEKLADLGQMTPKEQAEQQAIASELAPSPLTTTPAAEPSAGGVPESAPAGAAHAASEQAEAETLAGGLLMPEPDPAHKTDYVAWFNELGQVEGPDAAPLYEAACAQLVPSDVERTALYAAAMKGDPAALRSPEITQWLAANAEALAIFREASQRGACGWHLRSSDGTTLGVLLPNMAPLRSLAKLAVTDGRRLAVEGQPAKAAERYCDVLSAGAHVGSGATLIENLVGVAMQALGVEALLDLQADPAAQSLDYVALAAAAEGAARPPRSAPEAVQFERASFLDTVQRMWDVDSRTGAAVPNVDRARTLLVSMFGDDEPKVTEFTALVGEADYHQTAAAGNELYDAVTEALALPYQQGAPRLEQLDQWIAGDENTNPLLRTLMPALSRYNFIRTRGETSRRAALLVTHLNAYRQQQGTYPDSLAAFAERDFMVDPFSDTPFVYKRQGDDFVLYSVGGNGVDDGGTHDRRGETGDVLFWPRPR